MATIEEVRAVGPGAIVLSRSGVEGVITKIGTGAVWVRFGEDADPIGVRLAPSDLTITNRKRGGPPSRALISGVLFVQDRASAEWTGAALPGSSFARIRSTPFVQRSRAFEFVARRSDRSDDLGHYTTEIVGHSSSFEEACERCAAALRLLKVIA